MLDEYRKAKSSIKEAKAWDDDNIAPEVLKDEGRLEFT